MVLGAREVQSVSRLVDSLDGGNTFAFPNLAGTYVALSPTGAARDLPYSEVLCIQAKLTDTFCQPFAWSSNIGRGIEAAMEVALASLAGEVPILYAVKCALREGVRAAGTPSVDDIITFPSDTWAVSDYAFLPACMVCGAGSQNPSAAFPPPRSPPACHGDIGARAQAHRRL